MLLTHESTCASKQNTCDDQDMATAQESEAQRAQRMLEEGTQHARTVAEGAQHQHENKTFERSSVHVRRSHDDSSKCTHVRKNVDTLAMGEIG